MRAVIQRVCRASVQTDGKTVGEIQRGLCILLGICKGDTEREAGLLAEKTANLRIFEDEAEKLNLSLLSVGGEALVISNFTLCADGKKSGTRPSFTPAARPEEAEPLYNFFCKKLLDCQVKRVEKGIFGADMQVSLVNDGPVTLILDTDDRRSQKIEG